MAGAATEPVQGAWKKGPVFLELLRMATDPDSPPLASGYPLLPSPPSGPRKHTWVWIWTLLQSGWKGAEAYWVASVGICLLLEIFINPPQPLPEETWQQGEMMPFPTS